jgi:hypothetical protein
VIVSAPQTAKKRTSLHQPCMIKQDLETITEPHISNYMDSQPKKYDVEKLAQWAQKEKIQDLTVKGLQQLGSPTTEVDEEASKEWDTVLQAPDTDVSTGSILPAFPGLCLR